MKKVYKQNANDQVAKFTDCLLLLAASKLEPSTTQQSLFMTRITRFEWCYEIAYIGLQTLSKSDQHLT